MSRPTCAYILKQLRDITSVEYLDVNEYGVKWDDDILQEYLDKYSIEHYAVPYVSNPLETAHTVYYPKYKSHRGLLFEEDTLTFYDYANRVITASYTFNYLTNVVTFGSPRYDDDLIMIGRMFNLYESAAAIWEAKAALTYGLADWRAGHHFNMEAKIHEHCVAMARFYRQKTVKSFSHLGKSRYA